MNLSGTITRVGTRLARRQGKTVIEGDFTVRFATRLNSAEDLVGLSGKLVDVRIDVVQPEIGNPEHQRLAGDGE